MRFDELSPQAGLNEIREILREGQAALVREIDKSSTLNTLRDGAKKIGISALAGMIAKGAFDPGVATAAALLTFLDQYVAGSKKRQAKKALKAHFACLSGQGF